jgi:large subunit ribosomal protein L5
MGRLLEKYNNEIIPQMMAKFNYANRLQVPRIKKVVVNMGIGGAAQEIKELEVAMDELTLITGQRPSITRASKAISNFKIRKGSAVGCRVTLRRKRMYEFLDRLINVAIPRVKDFRGVPSSSFDNHNNYSLGITEHTIFPEIEYDKVQKMRGMDITIVMNARNRQEASELLKQFGMPFRGGASNG